MKRLMAVLFILMVGGCVQTVDTYPSVLDVKGFDNILEQPDQITCGPTSAVMVLRWHGKEASIDSVKRESRTEWFEYDGNKIGMTFPKWLSYAIKRHGMNSKVFSGNISDIKGELAGGNPPILLVRSGEFTWHYMVFIGYDNDNAIFADPGSGTKRVVSWENLDSCWKYNTDIEGGRVNLDCVVCGGTGRVFFLPVLGRCDACGGGGKVDPVRQMVSVYAAPNTYITIK